MSWKSPSKGSSRRAWSSTRPIGSPKAGSRRRKSASRRSTGCARLFSSRTEARSRSAPSRRCRSPRRTWSTPTTSSPPTGPIPRAGSCFGFPARAGRHLDGIRRRGRAPLRPAHLAPDRGGGRASRLDKAGGGDRGAGRRGFQDRAQDAEGSRRGHREARLQQGRRAPLRAGQRPAGAAFDRRDRRFSHEECAAGGARLPRRDDRADDAASCGRMCKRPRRRRAYRGSAVADIRSGAHRRHRDRLPRAGQRQEAGRFDNRARRGSRCGRTRGARSRLRPKGARGQAAAQGHRRAAEKSSMSLPETRSSIGKATRLAILSGCCALTVFAAGCTVRPLYATNTTTTASTGGASAALSSIAIDPVDDRYRSKCAMRSSSA